MAKRDALKDLPSEKHTFISRCLFAVVFCIALVTMLLVRLFNLQVLQHDYYTTRADDNRMRVVPVPPVRGLIYDRNGVVLAQNKPSFVLEITPEQITSLKTTLKELEPLVSITPRDIERFRDRMRKSPRYRGVPLRNNLTMQEVARFEINRYDFHGVDVTAGLNRNYPFGATTSHLVGYVGGINEKELQKIDPDAYQGLTQIGKTGVEKSHEDLLRGTPGSKIIEANAYGRPLRELDYDGGKPGDNLYLTLDMRVQEEAEQAMGDFDGALVAIDPRNGEIIAMVSKPGFDPQLFVDGIDSKTYTALNEDPDRPLFNRALQGLYPPGSTVKPAMALTGLEYGVVKPDHREFCPGEMTLPNSTHQYHCWKHSGHGLISLPDAITQSCDVFFYKLSLLLGIDRMHESMTQFGLGHLTGVDLPQEKPGLYPSREWKQRTYRQGWYPGETLNTAIGQGYVQVTPIQLAQMTARIAMRGLGFKPHILHAIQAPGSKNLTRVQPQALPPIVMQNPQAWDTVIQAMVNVTSTPHGTGYAMGKTAQYMIAAKTGTAQVAGLNPAFKHRSVADTPYRLRDQALFIAFAPADNPRIAIAVVAEHGVHGSIAGIIVRKVMDMYLLGKVTYQDPAEKNKAAAVAEPAGAADNAEEHEDEDEHDDPFPGVPVPTPPRTVRP